MAGPPTKTLEPLLGSGTHRVESKRETETDGSFRQIFEKYAPFVWRALRHLGIHESDIADQCQEVFLVVHRRSQDFEGRSTLETWIYGICLRVASDYRKRAHRRREIVQDEVDPGATESSQLSDVGRRQMRERLQKLLAELDQAQREVFVLYELEGREMKEIAELMGTPLQTAYSRLRLAREAIAAAYRKLQDEEAVK